MGAIQIQVRRDSAADWTNEDTTLAQGEVGWETDTGKFKIGDGSTAWTSLGYTSFVDDTAYNAGTWDANSDAASKNAVRDKIEAMGGGGANNALSNLSAVAISESLISDTNNNDDLGSDAKAWRSIYLDGNINILGTAVAIYGEEQNNTELCFKDDNNTGGVTLSELVNTTPIQETIVVIDDDTSITLSQTPEAAASVLFSINGVIQEQGAGKDYSISGVTITWLNRDDTLKATDIAIAYYRY